jgi:hypothetical protein
MVDNWIQLFVGSVGNAWIKVNILGHAVWGFNLKVTPFKIVPAWLSLYNTHIGMWL